MSATTVPDEPRINKGVLIDWGDGAAPAGGCRTFIVTGTHRSGTSLLAALLRAVGIFMGAEINDIVHEDEAIARIVEARDRAGLQRLIAERNAAYGTWGFKLPMLCRWLAPEELALFAAPRLIVTFRDPLAVAVRTTLSEYGPAMRSLQEAAADLTAISAFATASRCPKLLVSYEKLLAFPGDFIDAAMPFCGLPGSAALRQRLVGLIEPNRPSYIAGSRRRYEGLVEGLRDGRLFGWCRLSGIADPVALELSADGLVVRSFLADAFRQDLLDAGIGNGRHGFFLDVATLGVRPDAVVRITVAGQGLELRNSGQRLDGYG